MEDVNTEPSHKNMSEIRELDENRKSQTSSRQYQMISSARPLMYRTSTINESENKAKLTRLTTLNRSEATFRDRFRERHTTNYGDQTKLVPKAPISTIMSTADLSEEEKTVKVRDNVLSTTVYVRSLNVFYIIFYGVGPGHFPWPGNSEDSI